MHKIRGIVESQTVKYKLFGCNFSPRNQRLGKLTISQHLPLNLPTDRMGASRVVIYVRCMNTCRKKVTLKKINLQPGSRLTVATFRKWNRCLRRQQQHVQVGRRNHVAAAIRSRESCAAGVERRQSMKTLVVMTMTARRDRRRRRQL